MKPAPFDFGFHPIRRDQLRPEREHDSYMERGKPTEPNFCPECNVLYHAGRWQWGVKPEGASEQLCPACQRIRDEFPAGFVYISGHFFAEHRVEMISLIQHHAQKERAEHPLSRIMAIRENQENEGGIVITTTDLHLARDIGDALHHAYHGDLDFHYNASEKLLRVLWKR